MGKDILKQWYVQEVPSISLMLQADNQVKTANQTFESIPGTLVVPNWDSRMLLLDLVFCIHPHSTVHLIDILSLDLLSSLAYGSHPPGQALVTNDHDIRSLAPSPDISIHGSKAGLSMS
jgi:hypothetical protein